MNTNTINDLVDDNREEKERTEEDQKRLDTLIFELVNDDEILFKDTKKNLVHIFKLTEETSQIITNDETQGNLYFYSISIQEFEDLFCKQDILEIVRNGLLFTWNSTKELEYMIEPVLIADCEVYKLEEDEQLLNKIVEYKVGELKKEYNERFPLKTWLPLQTKTYGTITPQDYQIVEISRDFIQNKNRLDRLVGIIKLHQELFNQFEYLLRGNTESLDATMSENKNMFEMAQDEKEKLERFYDNFRKDFVDKLFNGLSEEIKKELKSIGCTKFLEKVEQLLMMRNEFF